MKLTKMKAKRLMMGGVVLALLAAASSNEAAEGMKVFTARSGSKMRLEGTSNVHDWRAESPFIGGSLEVGPNFPVEPGQSATPGKVEGKGDAFVPVNSLKSLEADGRPYSDRMDEVMWEHLGYKEGTTPARIVYHLKELVLKEAAKDKDSPCIFDTKGEIVINGVTNQVTMPVNVLPLGGKKLKITGTTTAKMSDFKIDPPHPPIVGMMIKTGDDVKLIFTWIVAEKP
jgi:hypothetical protein